MKPFSRKIGTALRVLQEKGPLTVTHILLKKIFPSDNVVLSWEARQLFRLQPVEGAPGRARRVENPEAMTGVNGQTLKGIRAAVARGEQCWIIEDAGRVIAYVWIGARTNIVSDTGYRIELGKAGGAHWWRDVYVDPAFRGQGLPGELLRCWSASLALEQRSELYTEIAPGNIPSIRAHQRLGFQRIGELYAVCILGARFFHVRRSHLPRFSFRFFPRNVYFTTITD